MRPGGVPAVDSGGRRVPQEEHRGAAGEASPQCCGPVARPHASPAEVARWARLFRALADPTRVGILALLQAQQRPLCVCDIVAHFPRGQPTISHHLKILRDAGLVRAERRGSWVYYAPAVSGLMEMWRAIARLVP